MTRFTLTVIDAAHVILSTEGRINPDERHALLESFGRWKAEGGVAVIGSCLVRDVRDQASVEIELDTSSSEMSDEVVDEFVRSHGGK